MSERRDFALLRKSIRAGLTAGAALGALVASSFLVIHGEGEEGIPILIGLASWPTSQILSLVPGFWDLELDDSALQLEQSPCALQTECSSAL